jgi:hypothetical protein
MKIDFNKVMMSVVIILVFGAILLISSSMTGCEPKTQGPPLETECTWSTPTTLTVVEYDSTKELATQWEFYKQQKLPDNAQLEGFATYNTRTQIHTLHILKIRGQKDSRRIETLGHELMHSFCGDWHPPYPGT